MNNREHWSPEELAMQNAVDRIREEYPDFWNDLSDLSDLSDLPGEPMEPTDSTPEEERRSRKKFRRRLIAACFVGVCLMSTALAIFINSDTAHAIKFAMEKKYYQAKGWVQATDPENMDNSNTMVIIETDEEKIYQYEEFWEPLMYPGYMSKNYVFDRLKIEKYMNGEGYAIFYYKKNEESIIITIMPSTDSGNNILWTTSNDIRNGTCEYNMWYDQGSGNHGLDVMIDDLNVTVRGMVEPSELIRIINGLNKK